MKKIIKGKVYDTEKAKCVGEWDNGYADSKFDSEYYKEILYIKRTREFFLYGYGKRNSKYSENTDGYWKGVEKIIPLSYDAAREWAEEHLTVSEYNAIFGTVVEDDTRKLITISMSVTAIEKAKRAASQAGMSLSAYIEKSVNTVSVVHGKWIDEDYPDRLATEESCIAICSVCGEHAIGFSDIDGCKQHIFTKFCPHCGAKMDLTE